MRRPERIALMVQELIRHPGQRLTLGHFSKLFDVAKSTVSEDLSCIREAFDCSGEGYLETSMGAGGGVRYFPLLSEERLLGNALRLSRILSEPDRVLAGGFIYMTDIVFSSDWSSRVGRVFASRFHVQRPDYVVTVETKGIPVALMTAQSLGIPLVVLRRDSKVTEGSTVSLHYFSGSPQKIQTMALPRRALPQGARVLVIDDFMRGGGTMRGICDLLREVGCEVAGIGVLVATAQPAEKRIDRYDPILILESVSEDRKNISLHLADWLRQIQLQQDTAGELT